MKKIIPVTNKYAYGQSAHISISQCWYERFLIFQFDKNVYFNKISNFSIRIPNTWPLNKWMFEKNKPKRWFNLISDSWMCFTITIKKFKFFRRYWKYLGFYMGIIWNLVIKIVNFENCICFLCNSIGIFFGWNSLFKRKRWRFISIYCF